VTETTQQAADAPQPKPEPKPNPIRDLTSHFVAAYDLAHSDGHAYAIPRDGLAREYGVPGVAQAFGAELRRKIVRLGPVVKLMVSRAAADTVMMHLEAKAFEGPESTVALRFHHDPAVPRLCIDLGRGDGRAIVIRPYDRLANPYGWTVERPPAGVVFRRSHATKPLPEPVRDVGRLDMLSYLWALDPAGEEFRALLGWVLGLPFCASVRPGALLVGPYGSGKSTRLRLAASLFEPASPTALGSAFGRNFGDDLVRAVHRAVPLWDNLTAVSGATSDALCCLVTGTARETRALYSDNDLNVVPVARPLGLTAVGVPAGLRPDALDRLITIDAPPLVARLDDAELQARFDYAHPALLGALCTALSLALKYLDKVPAHSEYRMAGHARMLAAVDAAIAAGELVGCPPGLLEAYAASNRRAKQRTATEDVFGGALLSLLDAAGGRWQGKASELCAAAGLYALGDRYAPGWPSSARRVPEVLNQLRDGLEAVGVTWSTSTVRGSTRYAFALADAPEPEDVGAIHTSNNAHHKPTPATLEAHPGVGFYPTKPTPRATL
jgi:energy-coupling factor transporter ATP-binding protein EcfA2